MKQMIKCILAVVMVWGMMLTFGINVIKAEEVETCVYDLDMAYWEGQPDAVYEYSFDKENWSTEHTWNLVVGEEYTVWVRRPSGETNPVNFIALPVTNDSKDGKDGNIDSAKEEPEEETTVGEITEKVEENAGNQNLTGENVGEEMVQTEIKNSESEIKMPVFLRLGIAGVLVIGGGAFVILRYRKRNK